MTINCLSETKIVCFIIRLVSLLVTCHNITPLPPPTANSISSFLMYYWSAKLVAASLDELHVMFFLIFCSKSNKASKSEPNTSRTIKSNQKLDDSSKSAGVGVTKPVVLNPLPGERTKAIIAEITGLCIYTVYDLHTD